MYICIYIYVYIYISLYSHTYIPVQRALLGIQNRPRVTAVAALPLSCMAGLRLNNTS